MTVENDGTWTIPDGASVRIDGVLDNSGSVTMNGATFIVGGGGLTVEGGGALSLSDGALVLDGPLSLANDGSSISVTDSTISVAGWPNFEDIDPTLQTFATTSGDLFAVAGTLTLNWGDTLDTTQGLYQNFTLGSGGAIQGGTVDTTSASGAGSLQISDDGTPSRICTT